MDCWPAEVMLIQTGILRHILGSHGSLLGRPDKGRRGRSVGVEECGTHCWLRPVHPLQTGEYGSSGEVQWQF